MLTKAINFGQVLAAEAVGDLAEDVTNLGTQQGQDGDDNDGDQDENESVLYQTLTFFTM